LGSRSREVERGLPLLLGVVRIVADEVEVATDAVPLEDLAGLHDGE